MSKPYIHSRRERIQPSFPNNKLSTRHRKKKVIKQERIDYSFTPQFRLPSTATFTPYDLPNPTDNAPTLFNNSFQEIYGDHIPDGTEVGITWSFAVSTGIYVWDADNGSTTTDPTASDTDGDGLPDGYIDLNGNGTIDLGEFEDFDCDGAIRTDSVWDVSQLYPSQLFFNETDPNKADTDGDSLSD